VGGWWVVGVRLKAWLILGRDLMMDLRARGLAQSGVPASPDFSARRDGFHGPILSFNPSPPAIHPHSLAPSIADSISTLRLVCFGPAAETRSALARRGEQRAAEQTATLHAPPVA
jgi:hypothetical protein